LHIISGEHCGVAIGGAPASGDKVALRYRGGRAPPLGRHLNDCWKNCTPAPQMAKLRS
jgi:hypothetical protein